eukprot:6063060-Amphidinium_carterae.1
MKKGGRTRRKERERDKEALLPKSNWGSEERRAAVRQLHFSMRISSSLQVMNIHTYTETQAVACTSSCALDSYYHIYVTVVF